MKEFKFEIVALDEYDAELSRERFKTRCSAVAIADLTSVISLDSHALFCEVASDEMKNEICGLLDKLIIEALKRGNA